MLLTLTTTHRPATDLGHLLVKHPDRTHAFDVPVGTAHVFYPQADEARCTAALLLDVDPTRLAAARGRGRGRQPTATPESFALGRYVNDRPYAASSLLASALSRVYRSALRGESRDRPELAATSIPLEIRVPVLRCRGGAEVATRLFGPLGWTVTAIPIALDEQHPQWGGSRYVDLTLTGTLRVADALNHLYVLLPVLDDAKHYWVAPDEVDKLLRVGAGWLAGHPERGLIVRRYLAHRRALAGQALERLAAQCPTDEPGVDDGVADRPDQAPRASLAARRREAVHAALVEAGAQRGGRPWAGCRCSPRSGRRSACRPARLHGGLSRVRSPDGRSARRDPGTVRGAGGAEGELRQPGSRLAPRPGRPALRGGSGVLHRDPSSGGRPVRHRGGTRSHRLVVGVDR
ncbi:hypothetical protein GCM10009541_38380 [Micromonospora gifhornensis]|uniref:Hen1 N-terminal domain-containing protein n=1 Tax=Micromonospora gifhornensis TaxID=84594 RepID=A0ABQ4IH00_9ACTN|nr:hypothetical protein Vgi01_37890 [Micromonospora gifhornensis]